ncbi:Phox homologous domain-containing protein [Calycina marina]|uniref:Phox homologous domain-containing protein n=1 Tax=Calycina marina TaxID=1763456 RepID=A0A9P7Z8Y7_9HELO|nr:Phox homologous domain-containing protein [Calycina marina]
MAPPVEITIPSTTLSTTPNIKPYTLYNITLRLPLRSFVVQKRYSDFLTLNSTLTSLIRDPTPSPLPGKSWFKSTASSPELTENRRVALEEYLRSIAEGPDRRWRDTSAWRQFLNLPSSSGSSVRSELVAAHQRGATGNQAAMDPTVWLDLHREMKEILKEARLFLGRRDGATTAQAQYEAGARAKSCLVKAGTLLTSLEEGVKFFETEERKRGEGRLGAGEVRRRRDLVASARGEKEGLEKLNVSLAVKSHGANGGASSAAGVTASTQDKIALFGPNVARPPGRVLGAPIPETDKTRELDNDGVLQLQKKIMEDQDLDVDELTKIVRRQKEMGLAIHGELELQNALLARVDEDAGRLKGKIDVAKKRAGKIS